MSRARLAAVAMGAAVVLAGCGSLGQQPTPAPTGPGTVAADWPVPNDRLTPGAVVHCTLPRPASERDVPAAEKTAVARAYRYTGARGIDHTEFDHRVPFSLCGSNGPANIWPEPYDGVHRSAFIANRKDQLEDVIARKVRYGDMTLAQGQAVFTGDWRAAWCRYVRQPGVDCTGF